MGSGLSTTSKTSIILPMEEHYKAILTEIGEDIDRPGLVNTPARCAKALRTLTRGYHINVKEVINSALFPSDANEMIIVKDIELYSLCEHHMLPFFGKCHIGYLPNGQVLGLSKLARIVDVFACRLQLQENLTIEIAQTIMEHTQALGVGVIIEAKHLCMMMRGVEKQNSEMKTSCMLGAFKDQPQTRSEFLNLALRHG